MLRRWLLYLAVLAGCVIFLVAYQGWYAWVILNAALCLPALGLVVSLPMMLSAKPYLLLPGYCTIGDPVLAAGDVRAPLGAPMIRWRIQVGSRLQKPDTLLSTDHCGVLVCRPARVRIYDCLGLCFRIPLRQESYRIFVRPKPVPVSNLPELERRLGHSWRPKPGGGLAENHELRLYRPGDSLNQIHWKLSAKTGKYIIREAMEPNGMQAILALTLGGKPEETDRKLGRLLWLGNYLLDKNLRFCIRARSGAQILQLYPESRDALLLAIDQLLEAPPAAPDAPEDNLHSPRLYAIGGEPDEG